MLLLRWAQCRSAKPLLWDYASERLSEEIMERVELHLGRCASCHKELDSLKRAQGLLAACRAQEEPAPRSDWNDLQQRLVTDGLAQIAPSVAGRRAQNPARRERVGMAGRAPWTMQLATSAAGGFAAVLVLALGYNALHPHNTPGAISGADTKSIAANTAGPLRRTASAASNQATPPVDNSQNAQLVADMIRFVKSVSSGSGSVADNSAPAQVRQENAAASETKGGAIIPASMRSNERRYALTQPSSFASRRSVDKTLVSGNSARKLRRDSRKSATRPSDAQPTQIASRYALERVQPIGSDGDESNAYVVGSVRPISRDDEGVY